MKRNKMSMLLFVMVTLFCGTSSFSQNKVDYESLGLSELTKLIRPDLLVGTHVHADKVANTPENQKAYNIIVNNYDLVSVGLYQRQTQSKQRDKWNFAKADPIVEFAKENKMTVYGHPLYGSNNYVPDWLRKGNYTNEELLEILEERVKVIAKRYKGKMHILDVYNEGLGRGGKGDWREKDNFMLQLGWHENELGRWPVFLEKLLIWSRKYGGKDLKLIYNDNHNTLLDMPQSKQCIAMYKALKKEGIPIDGIGIQCHTGITEKNEHRLSASAAESGPLFDAELFAANFRAMGEAGIDVYISECDVHLYGEITLEKLEVQAKAFQAIFKACIEESACKAFKTWGFTDADCWRPFKKIQPDPHPLVFDHDLNPKPSYFALREVVLEKLKEKTK